MGREINNCRLNAFHSGVDFKAHEFFGCKKQSDGMFIFRVWAPHAKKVFLCGDFNGWQKDEMTLLEDLESYELSVPAKVGDRYKYTVLTRDDRLIYKADPYAFMCDLKNGFSSVVCLPPRHSDYNGIYERQDKAQPVNIYEVNLLSWKRNSAAEYLSYEELEKELVPYVKDMGYTHVEFMPLTEFPYDGSWGYQVTGYFAVTSRLGTPKQFQSLVEAFHKEGIKVILDWVPAHFPKDDWGLYEFDGQPLYECPLWDDMEHSGWGTRKFDFGRAEVSNFLLSSAYFLIDTYRIDGLRIDAVASMLYLDYDKPFGDFTPNIYGGNVNISAVEFIKKLNHTIKSNFPGVITVAEESTAYNKVTGDVADGSLGFDYKWNMGWMSDTLFYCRQDPYFRNHHHEKITFSMVYAFSEKFILPLSHDEVVHVKGSIVNKMPGEYPDKFAGERALLGFMYAHPGKKLNFMGYEIAQFSEWDYSKSIEYFLTSYEKHAKMQAFVKELNIFYKNCRPFYQIDDSWEGFEWLIADDRYNNVFAFSRYSQNRECVTAVINFSGVDLNNYRIGISKGKYRLIFNTDDKRFGGDGKIKKKVYLTGKQSSNGKDYSLEISIPKLTCLYFIKEK